MASEFALPFSLTNWLTSSRRSLHLQFFCVSDTAFISATIHFTKSSSCSEATTDCTTSIFVLLNKSPKGGRTDTAPMLEPAREAVYTGNFLINFFIVVISLGSVGQGFGKKLSEKTRYLLNAQN